MYVQTLISDGQYLFIWEYFRPGNLPVGGAKLYYDDVSRIHDFTFHWPHPSVVRNVVDAFNQFPFSGRFPSIGLRTEFSNRSHRWTRVQGIAQLVRWRWRQQR
jgi:hypothetical protein